ncbi:MAG: MMPL family transporter [Syntrophales bacterium]|jgi:hypothetical protein|nr:MMPL family transporter [Syntrophales bacterium]
MGKLMRWSLKNAKLVIIINVIITLIAGYYAIQIRVDSSTEGMMIDGDPAKDYHRDTVRKFGSDNITVVFVRDKKLFTPEKLKDVEKVYYDLKDIKFEPKNPEEYVKAKDPEEYLKLKYPVVYAELAKKPDEYAKLAKNPEEYGKLVNDLEAYLKPKFPDKYKELLKTKTNVTKEEYNNLLKEAVDRIGKPGVGRCESLFSVTNFKGVGGGLETNPLMDRAPETVEDAKRIQADALKSPLFIDSLVSKDGQMTAINLYVDVDPSDPEFHTMFSKKVDEVTAKYQGNFDRVFQFGNSYGRRNIGENIITDQARIVPLACLVLICTIVIALRNFGAGIMPMITAGSSVICTFGFMVIAGIPLNVLTVIVPSILLVIGSAEDLHMMHEYLEGIEETNGDRDGSIKLMASKLGLAVLMTSITTVVGFASIMYNDISMLIQFGQVATVALTANCFATFTFGPALLHFFGPTKVRKHEAKVHFIDGFFKGIATGTLALVNNPRRKIIIIVTLSLLTLAMFGATFLVKVNNDFMGYFKADSEIRKRSDTLHKELAGAQTFFIRISSGMPDTFKQSEYLSQVAALQQFMAQKGWFDKTESLADRVALINREMNNGDKKFFAIPADSNLVSQYMLFFQRDEISRFVSPDFSEVSIMVRHNVSASYEITAILEELQKYMKKNMNPNFKFDVTGEYILINKAAESLAINSVTSLALTLFIVFLCMYFLFWSFKAGMISLVPNIFPIVSIYGIMGLLDIPLNVGTAMVADIAIGIAVDDTIHFMNRYKQAMQELQDSEAAVAAAVHDEVRPVVCSSIALAGGFAICAISQFIPVIQFGLLSAAVMIIAIVGELLITPILLKSTQLITLWDMIGMKLQDAVVKSAPFFDGLRPWSRRKVCLLGRMNEKNAGELAVVQGEMGKSMYLLLEGKADVIGHDEATKRDIVFATLNPGDIFGEIALVSPGPRSANVKATEPIKYLEIDWEGLKRIQKIYPRIGGQLFLNLSRILGERLISTNLMLFKKA